MRLVRSWLIPYGILLAFLWMIVSSEYLGVHQDEVAYLDCQSSEFCELAAVAGDKWLRIDREEFLDKAEQPNPDVLFREGFIENHLVITTGMEPRVVSCPGLIYSTQSMYEGNVWVCRNDPGEVYVYLLRFVKNDHYKCFCEYGEDSCESLKPIADCNPRTVGTGMQIYKRYDFLPSDSEPQIFQDFQASIGSFVQPTGKTLEYGFAQLPTKTKVVERGRLYKPLTGNKPQAYSTYTRIADGIYSDLEKYTILKLSKSKHKKILVDMSAKKYIAVETETDLADLHKKNKEDAKKSFDLEAEENGFPVNNLKVTRHIGLPDKKSEKLNLGNMSVPVIETYVMTKGTVSQSYQIVTFYASATEAISGLTAQLSATRTTLDQDEIFVGSYLYRLKMTLTSWQLEQYSSVVFGKAILRMKSHPIDTTLDTVCNFVANGGSSLAQPENEEGLLRGALHWCIPQLWVGQIEATASKLENVVEPNDSSLRKLLLECQAYVIKLTYSVRKNEGFKVLVRALVGIASKIELWVDNNANQSSIGAKSLWAPKDQLDRYKNPKKMAEYVRQVAVEQFGETYLNFLLDYQLTPGCLTTLASEVIDNASGTQAMARIALYKAQNGDTAAKHRIEVIDQGIITAKTLSNFITDSSDFTQLIEYPKFQAIYQSVCGYPLPPFVSATALVGQKSTRDAFGTLKEARDSMDGSTDVLTFPPLPEDFNEEKSITTPEAKDAYGLYQFIRQEATAKSLAKLTCIHEFVRATFDTYLRGDDILPDDGPNIDQSLEVAKQFLYHGRLSISSFFIVRSTKTESFLEDLEKSLSKVKEIPMGIVEFYPRAEWLINTCILEVVWVVALNKEARGKIEQRLLPHLPISVGRRLGNELEGELTVFYAPLRDASKAANELVIQDILTINTQHDVDVGTMVKAVRESRMEVGVRSFNIKAHTKAFLVALTELYKENDNENLSEAEKAIYTQKSKIFSKPTNARTEFVLNSVINLSTPYALLLMLLIISINLY